MSLALLIAVVFAVWLLLACLGGVLFGRIIAFGQRPVRDDLDGNGAGGFRNVTAIRPDCEREPEWKAER